MFSCRAQYSRWRLAVAGLYPNRSVALRICTLFRRIAVELQHSLRDLDPDDQFATMRSYGVYREDDETLYQLRVYDSLLDGELEHGN